MVMKSRHRKPFTFSLLTDRQCYRLTALQLCVALENVVDEIRTIDDDEEFPVNEMYGSYRYVTDYGVVLTEDRKQLTRPTLEEETSFYFDKEFSHAFRMPR